MNRLPYFLLYVKYTCQGDWGNLNLFIMETNLTDEEIVKFYKDVILRFEDDIKKYHEDAQKRRQMPISLMSINQTNDLNNRFQITIEDISLEQEIGEQNIGVNHIRLYIDIPQKQEDQEKSHYTYYTLYKRLRNSFAHGNIKKKDECYQIKDINDSGKYTMIAQIKTDIFFEYINKIYEKNQEFANDNNNK